jgi:hypothetical protein
MHWMQRIQCPTVRTKCIDPHAPSLKAGPQAQHGSLDRLCLGSRRPHRRVRPYDPATFSGLIDRLWRAPERNAGAVRQETGRIDARADFRSGGAATPPLSEFTLSSTSVKSGSPMALAQAPDLCNGQKIAGAQVVRRPQGHTALRADACIGAAAPESSRALRRASVGQSEARQGTRVG